MKKTGIKILVILSMMMATAQIAHSESLFLMSTSQAFYAEPKCLFSGVKARSVGDLVTIVMAEAVTVTDDLKYTSDRTSNTKDNFTGFLNKVIPGNVFNNQFNNFGGENAVESKVSTSRVLKFQDYITVQVVQLLPNGNLLVQGKKTLVNANERVDLLVSGVIDPRWINQNGQINSKNVANLQFASTGKGSTSRGGNEGVINRAVKYLF